MMKKKFNKGCLDTKTKKLQPYLELNRPKEGSNYRDPLWEKRKSYRSDVLTKRRRRRVQHMRAMEVRGVHAR
jgi:hypothetical protein